MYDLNIIKYITAKSIEGIQEIFQSRTILNEWTRTSIAKQNFDL